MKNLGTTDRILRVITAEVCLLFGFFWASREWQILAYLVAVVLTIQAATGACGIYKLLGIDTCEKVLRRKKGWPQGALAAVIVIAIVGGYASSVLTQNFFLEDFRGIKEPYAKVLLDTDKGLRQESVSDYEKLVIALKAFDDRYSNYRPLAIKFDDRFSADLQNVTAIVAGAGNDVRYGNLTSAHRKLVAADPALQGMLKRNGLPLI